MSAFATDLDRIAILGLDTLGIDSPTLDDTLHPPQLAWLTTTPPSPSQSTAKRFLHLLTAATYHTATGTLPAPDHYDVLPPLPPERLQAMPQQLADALISLLRMQPAPVVLTALWITRRYHMAIPEAGIMAVLERFQQSRERRRLTAILPAVLSARGRWLMTLNPAWQRYHQAAQDDFKQLSAFQRADWCTDQPQNNASEHEELPQLESQWLQAGTAQRLALLRTIPASASTDIKHWLATTGLQSTNKTIRYTIRCLLSAQHWQQYHDQAVNALQPYLQRSHGLLTKATIQWPTTADPALSALDIDGFVPPNQQANPALQALSALIILAGPDGLGTCLDCSPTKALTALAKIDQDNEIRYALFAACIQHGDAIGLATCCQRYHQPPSLTDSDLKQLCTLLTPAQALPLLSAFYEQKKPVITTHAIIWDWLHNHHFLCNASLTRLLLPAILTTIAKTDSNTNALYDALRTVAYLHPPTLIDHLDTMWQQARPLKAHQERWQWLQGLSTLHHHLWQHRIASEN
jgi:hypothetical protein